MVMIMIKKHANKYLKTDHDYTVERTEVGGYRTEVFLQEVPYVSFNSVHFKDK
jgi:hypothetical protein